KANGFNVISISETVEKMINTGLPKKCSYFRGKQITVDIASQPSIKMDEYILYAQELLEINNDIEFQIDKGCIIPVYSENMANHLTI
ncbi:uroporphyrinogen-III synthase, partial [Amylibacter sp.]|nr:uroporphyrinogen-III synthase [Amylibacter sp.]